MSCLACVLLGGAGGVLLGLVGPGLVAKLKGFIAKLGE